MIDTISYRITEKKNIKRKITAMPKLNLVPVRTDRNTVLWLNPCHNKEERVQNHTTLLTKSRNPQT